MEKPKLNCNSYYNTQRTETFVSITRSQKRWSNCDNQVKLSYLRKLTCNNQGWESGGKWTQKYGKRENVVQEEGDSDPPPVTPRRKVNYICDLVMVIPSSSPLNGHDVSTILLST